MGEKTDQICYLQKIKKKHEMGEQNSKAQVYCMRYTEFR